MGNIRQRVEDARFNYQNGRYEAALGLLLSAVDASAGKVYPKGTNSINSPVNGKGRPNEMGNKERYIRFLRVRFAQIMGVILDDDAYHKDYKYLVADDNATPEEHLYVAFRCSDAHESGLPENLKYVFDDALSDRFQLGVNGTEFRFSSGLLSFLEKVIVEAPCNSDEFGIVHMRILPKEEGKSVEQFISDVSKKHNVSVDRLSILKEILQFAGPEVLEFDDEKLSDELEEILDTKFNLGARTGLSRIPQSEPIFHRQGGLTTFGLIVTKDIINNSKFIKL
ncbi:MULTISPECIES: hypothetical protein [Enterobacter cloacae complex]|uniref:hypothetical protein n=1 Tax=Enterobacter cloacae complex TaxID=354276 RepID=UPI0037DC8BF8